jgi:hypothetical protein
LAHWKGLVNDERGSVCAAELGKVAHGILTSTEFTRRWTDTASRVDRLYLTLLHRIPDTGGRDYWINRYSASGDWPDTVGAFLASSESVARRLAICTHRDD